MAGKSSNESSGRRYRRLRAARGVAPHSQRRLTLESLEDRRMLAIDFDLVEDINTAGLPLQIGKPTNLTTVGETLFFTTERITFTDTQSLWKIDPTTHEAVLLKTFSQLGINTATEFAEFNGSLYFTANDGTSGFELWKSDGTAAGTVLVKDTIAGFNGGAPTSLTNANGVLYFVVYEGSTSPSRPIQLWKSDGTTAGTAAVSNIGGSLGTIGVGDSYTKVTRNITAVGSTVYFVANGASGVELWRSDGTAAGTAAVADIRPGTSGSNPVQLTAIDDLLYFSANDGTHGHELWRTDGTVAGTTMVVDLNSGAGNGFFRELIEVNGTLFFRGNDGVEGSELWKSDGTAAGTEFVKSFRPEGFSGEPDMFFNWAGTLYFTAASDLGGFGLWKSDGTTAGTTLVRPVGDGGPYMDYPRDLDAGTPWAAVLDDELYFLGNYNQQLWKTDGTAAGTVPVRQLVRTDVYPSPTISIEVWMTAASGRLFFVQFNGYGLPVPQRLWVSDGTALGTLPVAAAGSGTDNAFDGWMHQTIDGVTYFTAKDVAHGAELWRTDGTAAGTYLVRDINPGVMDSGISRYTVLNGIVYFPAYNGRTNGLWRSDGTEAGTWQVTSLPSIASWLTVANGSLYFQLRDSSTGLQLWKSNGTAAGTSLVKVVAPVGTGASTNQMVEFNGEIYFRSNDGVSGEELWKSNGAAAGTVLVHDATPGSAGTSPSNMIVAGEFLYFTSAVDNVLWRTDGTSTGTIKVGGTVPLRISNTGGGPFMQEVNGSLYLVGDGSDGAGMELWRTDGSADGTFRLTDIVGSADSTGITNLSNVNGVLLFTAMSQRQIWRSDGTVAGTTLVATISSTLGNISSTNGFTQVGADSWLTVGTSTLNSHSVELWRTDGTAAGTMIVDAVQVDSLFATSGPPPVVVGNYLVLPLRTAEYGIELWSAQFIETPPLAGDFNRDGVVDGADFLFWQRNLGAAANPYGAGADGDLSGRVGSGDLSVWKENYGTPVPPVAPVASRASTVVPDVHRAPQPVAAPLAATSAASPDLRDESSSWSVVAEKPTPRAKRGRLHWFLNVPAGSGGVGSSMAFHGVTQESKIFPSIKSASLWKNEGLQARDLLADQSLVAGRSGPHDASFPLRAEKSSPFDGEEIDWRLEQLFQTERLAETDSRDEL